MESEILSDDELAEITGYKIRAYQLKWLDAHRWLYVESRGKRPLVGRQYVRMKLGINPAEVMPPPTAPSWTPDFSRVK